MYNDAPAPFPAGDARGRLPGHADHNWQPAKVRPNTREIMKFTGSRPQGETPYLITVQRFKPQPRCRRALADSQQIFRHLSPVWFAGCPSHTR